MYPLVISFKSKFTTVRINRFISLVALVMQFTDIGVVSSIEVNHKSVEQARQGTEVCIRVESTGDAPRLYGRHFDHTDMLVSKVSWTLPVFHGFTLCIIVFRQVSFVSCK